jgi:hypothetical protein
VRKVYICSLQHFYAVNGLRKVPGEFEAARNIRALLAAQRQLLCLFLARVDADVFGEIG